MKSFCSNVAELILSSPYVVKWLQFKVLRAILV